MDLWLLIQNISDPVSGLSLDINITSLKYGDLSDVSLERNGVASTVASIAYFVLCCVGVPGNAIVMALVLFWMDLKNTSNILVLNLAVADLLYVAWLPVLVYKLQLGTWPWGDFACRLYYSVNVVNQFGGMLFLTALSIDRYCAICRPKSKRELRTPRNAAIAAMTCWCIVIVASTPTMAYSGTVGAGPIFGDFGNETFTAFLHELPSEKQCVVKFENIGDISQSTVATIYTFCCFVIAYVVPMLLMWTLYILTSIKLANHELKMRNYRLRGSSNHAACTVICLVAFYFTCWTPFWVLQLLIDYWRRTDQMEIYDDVIPTLGLTSYAFAYLNAAINPYFFLLVSSEVRTAMNSRPRCIRKTRIGHHMSRNSTTTRSRVTLNNVIANGSLCTRDTSRSSIVLSVINGRTDRYRTIKKTQLRTRGTAL